MTELNQIYKCTVCGNVVEVVHTGAGELVCCGQPMQLQQENTVDAAKEKHVPVVEEKDGKFLVKVGSVAHPTEDSHFIEWIEAIIDGRVIREYLKPGDAPKAEFYKQPDFARAYCNVHGLWKSG